MNDKEKANKIAVEQKIRGFEQQDIYACVFEACMEMANWKDDQQKETLLKFMQWLEKRGFIKEDLCYDTEHQVETFVNQILPQL